MDKRMNIRRDDHCASCGAALAAGTEAYWMPVPRVVRCVPCYSSEHDAIGQTTIESGSSADVPTADVAGKSARLQYERRSGREKARKAQVAADDTAWRRSIKEQRPVVGRLASALTPGPAIKPESQATAAWKTGAEGEERVAEVLRGVPGVEVLHDRRVPGSRANIDHIVVGSAGVFVIDAKKYTGRIEVRDFGGWFRLDERLYIDGRDRTKLVDGVLGQLEVVRAALGNEFAEVPVHGVLCFIGCEWGLLPRTKTMKRITALWPRALPGHVATRGQHDERMTTVARRLRSTLRPATG